jgi:purine-binding chemotaxis protein CheW
MKTPEEYLKETVQPPEEQTDESGLTAAEQAFLSKYVGLAPEEAVKGIRSVDPSAEDTVMGAPPKDQAQLPPPKPEAEAAKPRPTAPEQATAPPPPAEPRQAPPVAGAEAGKSKPDEAVKPRPRPAETPPPPEEDFDEQLRQLAELQLVGFKVGTQDFALPISVIQEVIRYVEPTKLPSAPSFVSGIVNLRGRVTPMVNLRTLLSIKPEAGGTDDFIIVCRHRGLQVGLSITAISTMYRTTQDKIEWGIETHVGIHGKYLSGMMKDVKDKGLINIISIERLVSRVLAG